MLHHQLVQPGSKGTVVIQNQDYSASVWLVWASIFTSAGSWLLFLALLWCVCLGRIYGSHNTVHTRAVWQFSIESLKIGKLRLVQAAEFFCSVSWHIKKERNNLLETNLTERSPNQALLKHGGCLMHCILALSIQVYEGCRGCSWCWKIFSLPWSSCFVLHIKIAVKRKFWQKALCLAVLVEVGIWAVYTHICVVCLGISCHFAGLYLLHCLCESSLTPFVFHGHTGNKERAIILVEINIVNFYMDWGGEPNIFSCYTKTVSVK